MISKLTIQKVKDAANIVDVIRDFLTLKKKGTHYECLCPFHDDHHIGSFVVSPAHNCYNCFSCEAKGGAIDFLMNYKNMSYPDAVRYLAIKYGIPLDDDDYDKEKFRNIKPAKPRDMVPLPDDLPKRLWPAEWIMEYKDLSSDNLVRYLKTLPLNAAATKRIGEALADYHIGHCHFNTYDRMTRQTTLHEFTIFWMLDEKGRLHNGHLMKFYPPGNPKFGHRDKEDAYPTTWLHARMRYVQGKYHFDGDKEAASYCLFGQHLMNKYPNADINLVESEKTALLMAIIYGNDNSQIWMATSGMNRLTKEYLAPLMANNRRIVLFPDRDGVQKWAKVANELTYPVQMNTQAVRDWWKPCDGVKADIADVVTRILNEQHNNGTKEQ